MITLKEFNNLVKLCKKLGITYYKCADFEFELGLSSNSNNTPKKRSSKVLKSMIPFNPETIPTEGISDEELMFWSSGGSPKDENETT